MISYEEAMLQDEERAFGSEHHGEVKLWVWVVNEATELWRTAKEHVSEQQTDEEREIATLVEELCWFRMREARMVMTSQLLTVAKNPESGLVIDQKIPVPRDSDVWGLPPSPNYEGGARMITHLIDGCRAFITEDTLRLYDKGDKLLEFIHKMTLVLGRRWGINSTYGRGLHNLIESLTEFRKLSKDDEEVFHFFLLYMPHIMRGCYLTHLRDSLYGVCFKTKIFIHVPAKDIPQNLRGLYVGYCGQDEVYLGDY